VKLAAPEIAANALLCATHQAVYLLKRQFESQAREFTEKGGFSEKLYQERIKARNRQGR
jgi:four helix bundle suffix protein